MRIENREKLIALLKNRLGRTALAAKSAADAQGLVDAVNANLANGFNWTHIGT